MAGLNLLQRCPYLYTAYGKSGEGTCKILRSPSYIHLRPSPQNGINSAFFIKIKY